MASTVSKDEKPERHPQAENADRRAKEPKNAKGKKSTGKAPKSSLPNSS